MFTYPLVSLTNDLGRIVHQGGYVNPHQFGQTVPLVVVVVYPDEYGEGVPGVNGQAVLDGPGAFLWVTSAREGAGPGQWGWPPLEPATAKTPEPSEQGTKRIGS